MIALAENHGSAFLIDEREKCGWGKKKMKDLPIQERKLIQRSQEIK